VIFITTGTSLSHDDLIRKIDSLKAMGQLRDSIYAQIGNGKYIPNNMKWLRFVGNMEDVYRRAEIIIGNCGAGTILENVTQGRKLIAVQNPDITGGHEWELVSKMEILGCLIWCKDVDDILEHIESARNRTFNTFIPEKFNLELILGEEI
jgi:UDP-N-acetylglucosamine transferase subunit ALG13